MFIQSKRNITFLNSLRENSKFPFVAFGQNGNIISFNEEASNLLGIKKLEDNLFELFSESSAKIFSELIEDAYQKGKTVSKDCLVSLMNESTFSSNITANTFKEDNETFIFCFFKLNDLKLGLSGKTKVRSNFNDLPNLINDKNLLEVLYELNSTYPFTFIGKEKILSKINLSEDLFWIKNTDGKFVVANQSLSKIIGLTNSQLEGKDFNSYIPSYIKSFLSSIENYILETLNLIVIEGVSIFNSSSIEGTETIFSPVIDSENKIIAIIGIVQKLKQSNQENLKSSWLSSDINFLQELNDPICFIDKNGIIRHQSKEFCKLFSVNKNDFRNFRINEALPENVAQKIEEFIISPLENISTDISKGIKEIEKGELKFNLKLNKIIDNDNQLFGIWAFIEKVKTVDDFTLIINNRGRMFDLIIQGNPEPIFIYDTENLRFIEVNEAALALYGYSKNEFMQMDLTDLYTADDIQTLLESSSASTTFGKFTGPFKQKRKNGSFVYVEISKLSFRYNDKDAHFNIIKDVTEKLDNEKKNQIFKSTFDNTDDLVFITDESGFISYINSSVEKTLGASISQYEGTSFPALFKDEDRGNVNASIFQSNIKEPISLKASLKRNEEEFLESIIKATPILDFNSNIDSFTIILKIYKDQSQEISDNLGKSLTGDPTPQKDTDKSATLSQPILTNLFHEILTPINVILGFVQELKESIMNPSIEQKEAIDFINQNRTRLLSTMNSIIEFTGLSQGNLELKFQNVQITELIDYVQEEIKDLSKTRGIEFSYGKISSSLVFETDKEKFKSLISAMTKIIIQLAKSKKIYLSAYQKDESSFIISLRDNYSNISQSLFNSLFSLFSSEETFQIKDSSISKISIKLVKTLLKLLKGEFKILEQSKDKNDLGFVFPILLSNFVDQFENPIKVEIEENQKIDKLKEESLEIEHQPLAISEDEQIFEENEYEPERIIPLSEHKISRHIKKYSDYVDLSALNCLYIEDQIDSQILFKVQLKELREIKFAVSFEEALPLLDSNHFDFIVMDINLQGEYNGLDALKIIHKMPGYENIPIIAVTAYVLPGDKEKFIATGFTDFISKPIFREKMIEALKKIFLMQE